MSPWDRPRRLSRTPCGRTRKSKVFARWNTIWADSWETFCHNESSNTSHDALHPPNLYTLHNISASAVACALLPPLHRCYAAQIVVSSFVNTQWVLSLSIFKAGLCKLYFNGHYWKSEKRQEILRNNSSGKNHWWLNLRSEDINRCCGFVVQIES